MSKKVIKKNAVKAYKVFEPDFSCRDFKFQVGKTFIHKGTVQICRSGFHACLQVADCFSYYSFDSDNKVAEVLLWGETDTHEEDTKICASNIEIVREISWQEVLVLANTGKDCTGLRNSGDRNSGNRNSGDRNSGNGNSGDRNTGNRNTGNRNSGNGNTGNGNSGDRNSGDRNSGNGNSGNGNSGNGNTGNGNSGDRNSGDRNSGDRNTGNGNTGNRNSGNGNTGNGNTGNGNSGDWNSGDWNVRFFCSNNQKIYLFDLPVDLSASEIYSLMPSFWNYDTCHWVDSSGMTDEEKANNPHYETTNGYLKSFTYKEMCRNGWAQDDDENKLKFFRLPNFTLSKFQEVTGIDASEDFKRLIKLSMSD